jgi:hypothetical protein
MTPFADACPSLIHERNFHHVTVAPTKSAAPCRVEPFAAHAEFYDLISRSIVSMAVSIFSNDLPARILASA